MLVIYITQLPSRRNPESGAYVPTVDVTPAKLFGDLRFIFPPGMNVQDMRAAAETMKVALRDFDPASDYLLPMGDPALMVLAAAQLGSRWVDFKILKWDRHSGAYFTHKIET